MDKVCGRTCTYASLYTSHVSFSLQNKIAELEAQLEGMQAYLEQQDAKMHAILEVCFLLALCTFSLMQFSCYHRDTPDDRWS